MKVWITKYAMTTGIFKVEVKDIGSGMVEQSPRLAYGVYYHGEGRDWHRTRDGAVVRAISMRTSKIKSLKAQVVKLERLKF